MGSRRLSSTLERGRDVRDLLQQSERAGYAMEAMMLVEGRRLLADRVDDDESGSDGLGDTDHSPECLSKQGPAEPLAVQRLIERKPGQQHSRDLAWPAAPDRVREIFPAKKMRGQ